VEIGKHTGNQETGEGNEATKGARKKEVKFDQRRENKEGIGRAKDQVEGGTSTVSIASGRGGAVLFIPLSRNDRGAATGKRRGAGRGNRLERTSEKQ